MCALFGSGFPPSHNSSCAPVLVADCVRCFHESCSFMVSMRGYHFLLKRRRSINRRDNERQVTCSEMKSIRHLTRFNCHSVDCLTCFFDTFHMSPSSSASPFYPLLIFLPICCQSAFHFQSVTLKAFDRSRHDIIPFGRL